MLVLALLATAPAWAQTDYSAWGTADGADGSEQHPYVITTTEGLDLLSSEVNSGAWLHDIYFVLGADITYSHTTDWNDDTSTESNFSSIGTGGCVFNGIFDGRGHTIRGIRIYSTDGYQGLFGSVNSGTVRNVILADARIMGAGCVGGIAGRNSEGSVVENCYVCADVFIGSTDTWNGYYGGIAGVNGSGATINACTSCATFMKAQSCGGIVGENLGGCTVSNCRAIGITLYVDESVGAIVGSGDGTLSHNYYSECTKIEDEFTQDTENIGIGRGGSSEDVSDNDGAVRTEGIPLLDGLSNEPLIADYSSRTDEWGVPESHKYTLAGRTLYKDGSWNTLCLPINLVPYGVVNETLDTPASIMELTSTTFEDGVLTLNFTEIDRYVMYAGKPYIVRWNRADDYTDDNGHNLWQPTTADNREASTTSSPSTTDWVDFVGSASPVSLKADDRTVLFLGADNKLYYPDADMQIGSCRGYFQLKQGLTAGDPTDQHSSVKGFVLNFGEGEDGTTGIPPLLSPEGEEEVASPRGGLVGVSLYTLDGRRLNGKPTAKGIYIHNGRKVIK